MRRAAKREAERLRADLRSYLRHRHCYDVDDSDRIRSMRAGRREWIRKTIALIRRLDSVVAR